MNRKSIVIGIMVWLAIAIPAFAGTGNFTITPVGNGVFIISGNGLSDVAGLDVTVGYDASVLANPRIAKGSLLGGALLASSTNHAGSVRLGILNSTAIAGAGTIATITFDTLGSGKGTATLAQVAAIDIKGKTIATRIQVDSGTDFSQRQSMVDPSSSIQPAPTSAVPSPAPVATSGNVGTIGGNGTAGTVAWLGEVTMPDRRGGTEQRKDDVDAISKSVHEPAGIEQVKPTVVAVVPGTIPSRPSQEIVAKSKFVIQRSVLDKFREFNGQKTPAALTGLFNETGSKQYRQEPDVALSNGDTIRLFIVFTENFDRAPNFAMHGARLIKLHTENSEWVLDVLPEKGTIKSSVTLMLPDYEVEIPLTVAPPMDKAVEPGEKQFQMFLKETGTVKAPRYDLNSDGKRDYLDDYIFTANYIVKRDLSKQPKVKEPKHVEKTK